MALLLPFALALATASPAPVAAPVPAQIDGSATQIEALRQRLLAAQQTIATLERQIATVKDRAVLADQCRVKNGRLVFIARELIEGYEKRYHEEHKDPLQLGRRRFEFELQALSDAVYDNRAEVPVRVPNDKSAAPEKPATPDKPVAAGKPELPPLPAKPDGH